MPTLIKICGLLGEEAVDAAGDAGADYVGFVFFAPSSRNVTLRRAAELAMRVRDAAKIVALTVDADDALIAEIVRTLRPDLLQLHGSETPKRVAVIKKLARTPVMKAVGIGDTADLDRATRYGDADSLLLDAKPPRGATRPGGNGAAFDWTLLTRFAPEKPWLLSGGLDAANVVEAMAMSGAPGVDVSSGVETAPGRKDPALIRDFVAAVRAVDGNAPAAFPGDADHAPLRRAV